MKTLFVPWRRNYPILAEESRADSSRVRKPHRPGIIAGAILSAALLACRFTAGPPVRETPTRPAPAGTAAIQLQPATPPQGQAGRAVRTITPISLPTETPRPTLSAELPDDLLVVQPENIANLRPLARPVEPGDRPFTDFAFSPDGQIMAVVACDQGLALWDSEDNLPLTAPAVENPAACQGIWQLAFSPSGLLLASTANAPGSQNVVQLWTVSVSFGAQPLQRLLAGDKPVSSLSFSPDGRILAAGTQDNLVKLWFITDPGDPLATPITELGELPLADWAVDVDFSPDGRWLAAGTAEQQGDRFEPAVQLWKVQDLLKAGAGQASVFATLAARSGPLRQIGFSPDSRFLAAAGGGVTFWESEGERSDLDQEEEAGSTIRWIERAFLEMPVDAIDFSPDGELLAGGGQDLWMWDMAAGLENENFDVPVWTGADLTGEEIFRLVFAPGGQALATLSAEGLVTLWGIQP